ncbi:MAG: RecX family transcriptional regulator [Chloroflexota bacterium]
MSIVTDLTTQQHDPERVNVELDGRFGFGASKLVVITHGLCVGDDLTDEEMEALQKDDEGDRVYSGALNFLSYRPRSRREVEMHFRRKGVSPQLLEAVLNRLEGSGLIDDPAFASFWVENRETFKPRSRRALRTEMRQKGISGHVAEEALANLPDEEEIAYRAGLAKMRSYQNLDRAEFNRKLIAFLQRRGFAYGAAAAAANRLADDTLTDPL